MNKIVISLMLAVLTTGCTTVYVTLPDSDANVEVDGGMMEVDGSVQDVDVAIVPPDAGGTDASDASDASDAAVEADTGPDPICADDPSCCANGQPIRVGLVCGNYPASAQAVCTAAGVCQPNEALHTCDIVTACCDGWRAIVDSSVACNCVHTGTPVSSNKWGCDPAQVTVGPGNGLGHCGLVSYPANGFACVSPTQYPPTP